jgi:hypothetical protein
MTLILPGPVAIPVVVALAFTAGRILGRLAREARLITIAWLALRGTKPDERPEILRALGRAGWGWRTATCQDGDSPATTDMGSRIAGVGDNAHRALSTGSARTLPSADLANRPLNETRHVRHSGRVAMQLRAITQPAQP